MTLSGGSGNGKDTLFGGTQADLLLAGDGGSYLSGGDGDDTLVGGNGNDTLVGGNGDDLLLGGASNDSLSGGNGNDSLSGGGGQDMVYGGTFPSPNSPSTDDSTANWVIEAGDFDFNLNNSTLIAQVHGSPALTINDKLFGIQNADLTGGASSNIFTVTGWTGGGTLHGGGGPDTVVFSVVAYDKGFNIHLTDTSLEADSQFANVDMFLNLDGITVANLSGNPTSIDGDGTTSVAFFVDDWSGTGSLSGGPGDAVFITAETNFNLSDTEHTAGTGLDMQLNGLNFAYLSGGTGNNTFDVGGWTRHGTLNGGDGGHGGTDTVVVTADTNVKLSDADIQANTGLDMFELHRHHGRPPDRWQFRATRSTP